mmetsp:Transcript_16663/g.29955  ORF Transcript_16663/g.29955 Transcript_16663/m.29955 type:complete len:306 (+) Transcript_16663:29-946(+)
MEGGVKRPRSQELTVLVGDDSGLVKSLEPGDDEEIKVKVYGEQQANTAVRALIVDPEGTVIVGRKLGQVDKLSLETEQFEALNAPQASEMLSMSYWDGKTVKLYKNSHIEVGSSTFRVENSKPRFAAVSSGNCAVAGKDFPLQTYDLTTQQATWKAWILSIENIREKVNDLRCVYADPQKIVVTTAFNHVRLYDVRAGRKPVKNTQLNTAGTQYCLGLISLHQAPSSHYFVGDTVGHVYKLNEDFQILKKVKDKGNGAVRDIISNEELLFTASLDRSLRVYDSDTLELQRKVQLWQKLNCLALIS